MKLFAWVMNVFASLMRLLWFIDEYICIDDEAICEDGEYNCIDESLHAPALKGGWTFVYPRPCPKGWRGICKKLILLFLNLWGERCTR